MKKQDQKAVNSPTLGRKSLKLRPLCDRVGRTQGVNKGRRTGDKKTPSKKSMLPRSEMRKAFLEIARFYGRKAKGVKKTMSPAAIEQRRRAGQISAYKRGFITALPHPLPKKLS